MILVDTSIWIRFLANRQTVDRMDVLFQRQEVAGHELILGEPLIGHLVCSRTKIAWARYRLG